jgi:hypothetical protein
MLKEGLFWLALAATAYPAWRIFRDMGDITQIFMKVDRATILDTIRWERRLIAMAVAGIAIMSLQYFAFDAGRAIVAAYDEGYESLWIWYNDSDSDITRVDFRGESEQGRLKRVETVRAGAYWCVWAHYFPTTEINRNNINTQFEAA